MTTNQSTNQPTESTAKPEEILALKFGYKLKNGKPDVNTFKKVLFKLLLDNDVKDIDVLSSAIKLYSKNGIAKHNQVKSQETTEKIENAIKKILDNGEIPTKTLLNKKYGINYIALKNYQELHPDMIYDKG